MQVMFYKLSMKNVRRSYKDYTLYFLTLTLSVCIFYVFNSIEAQKAMMHISESAVEMMKTITMLIDYISVFVCFVLGFLIVYANNFLIRRRKRELGIYMTLGMKKGKVAKLLVAETFTIGVISLGAGLLAGIFLSQGLSVITAKLFEADMTGYRFIFSSTAFLKTVLYFSVIFLIVMVLSTLSISRYKLIDLIHADKQNERQKIKNPLLTVILFVLSIAFLGVAYGLVLKNGIQKFDNRLYFEMTLGAIGTFLFFASLSGFFLRLLQTNKKRYYKGLNMFILRQINSKINTAHISMSFICLMLFCTIGILSTGLGATDAMNQGFKSSTPFDASFRAEGDVNIAEEFKKYNIDLSKYTDRYMEYNLYRDNEEKLTMGMILEKVAESLPDDADLRHMEWPLPLIRLSDYNELMDMRGLEEVSLPEGHVAVYSDYAQVDSGLRESLLKYINGKYSLTISGKNYKISPELLTNGIITSPNSSIILALVVPDRLTQGCKVKNTVLSFNCSGNRKETQIRLESDLMSIVEIYGEQRDDIVLQGATAQTVRAIEGGSKAIVSFVGIYLGIIFLITSAAVLALQQLSEAADNRSRYSILQKVGADEKLINSALFKQIAIYFLLPLLLACIHSVVGIKVANDVITEMGHINVLGNIIITALLIALVYGSYFLATYFSSRQILLKVKT
jgi:putative ABC transport system permease protein